MKRTSKPRSAEALPDAAIADAKNLRTSAAVTYKKLKPRDDFTLPTKRALAEQAGLQCSCPSCSKLTKGPKKGVNGGTAGTGKAAHIVSASPEHGPRADSKILREQRRSFDNGIWLCSEHATIIDSDPNRYSVKLLKRWKEDHVERIALMVSGVWVGNGIIKEIEIENLGGFQQKQLLTFAPKTLILGTNTTGKTLLCDMIASLDDQTFAESQLPVPKGATGTVRMTTFGVTTRRWELILNERLICKLDRNPVPILFGGFNVIYIRDIFRRSPLPEDYDPETVSDLDRNNRILDDLSAFLGFAPSEVLAIVSSLEDDPGILSGPVRVVERGIEVITSAPGLWMTFGQISSGERQLLLLDIILRAARFSGETTPTILILEQNFFHTLDKDNQNYLLRKLAEFDGPFQLIVTMYSWPAPLWADGWRVWQLKKCAPKGGEIEVDVWNPPDETSSQLPQSS